MKKIIVDMMGGDLAPVETVKGVALAAKELSAELVLVGDREQLLAVAAKEGISLDGFEILHA